MAEPRVFIGSSSEQLETARAVKQCLGSDVEAVVWDEAGFALNESTFGALTKMAERFDFAVFVFDADDVAQIRRTEVRTVRAFNKLLWLQNDLITRHYQAAGIAAEFEAAEAA